MLIESVSQGGPQANVSNFYGPSEPPSDILGVVSAPWITKDLLEPLQYLSNLFIEIIQHIAYTVKIKCKVREQCRLAWCNKDIVLHTVTQTRFALYLDTKTEQNGPLSSNTSINGIFECMPFTHVL